jgi:predicted aminopeptidase
MRKSRPIAEVLAAPETSPALRRQLTSVETIRRFASDHLSLPGHDSYGTYADLGRPHVTWVLYAAPEFSLKPKTWWYPTLGRLDYRGFFREEDTRALSSTLRADGLDVVTGGVDAYSTLGWFHDPVLNCFVDYPEVALAELLFHELTHRRLFRAGDTDFNEALATAYAEQGVKLWLRHEKRFHELRDYEALLVRRNQFYQEIDRTRAALGKLYASGLPADSMRPQKAALMRNLQSRFRDLRRRWGGRGLESWLEGDLTNAHLVSVITYHEHTPAFDRLFEECGRDPEEFFKRAASVKLPGGQ